MTPGVMALLYIRPVKSTKGSAEFVVLSPGPCSRQHLLRQGWSSSLGQGEYCLHRRCIIVVDQASLRCMRVCHDFHSCKASPKDCGSAGHPGATAVWSDRPVLHQSRTRTWSAHAQVKPWLILSDMQVRALQVACRLTSTVVAVMLMFMLPDSVCSCGRASRARIGIC